MKDTGIRAQGFGTLCHTTTPASMESGYLEAASWLLSPHTGPFLLEVRPLYPPQVLLTSSRQQFPNTYIHVAGIDVAIPCVRGLQHHTAVII